MNLQFAILGILTYFPLNGYDLGKILDKAINNFWHASLSQIYRELGTLEKKGFVTSSIQQQGERPDKRIYTITSAGEEAFEEWLNTFPRSLSAPKRDEFSLRVFFGGKMSRESLKYQFERFLQERKAFASGMLENKKTIHDILSQQDAIDEGEDIGMRFIMRRAILSNQALLQWAEECLDELDKEELS